MLQFRGDGVSATLDRFPILNVPLLADDGRELTMKLGDIGTGARENCAERLRLARGARPRKRNGEAGRDDLRVKRRGHSLTIGAIFSSTFTWNCRKLP